MKTYMDFVKEALPHVQELFPWDLEEELGANEGPEQRREMLLLDVREPYEFDTLHIEDSLNVPRGVLEQACEPDYEETQEELVQGRERPIVVICRSGHRSVLAARVLQLMGYADVRSLKTGIRGWCDYELPTQDREGNPVPQEAADAYFTPPEQLQGL